MEMEQIKTYSKKNPITPYASSAELVKKIEQNANAIDTISQESNEDCEKTLEMGNFENTFDRLAAGVV